PRQWPISRCTSRVRSSTPRRCACSSARTRSSRGFSRSTPSRPLLIATPRPLRGGARRDELTRSRPAGHVAVAVHVNVNDVNDHVNVNAASGGDMPARLNLQTAPARALFSDEQWTRISQAPNLHVADADWAGFSRDQRTAIKQLQAQLRTDGMAAAPR